MKITQYLFGAGASEAVAEWPAEDKIPLVQVWIDSRYPSDLMDLRQIFWTAQFPGFTPVGLAQQDCREAAVAMKNADALLDTGLVSMLVAGAAPPLPRGNAVFEFTFDTSGALRPLDIPTSTIPHADLNRLAAIVGSNVRQQPRVAARAGLRLELDSTGVSYSLLPVSACGRP